jgi:hypothetical protein
MDCFKIEAIPTRVLLTLGMLDLCMLVLVGCVLGRKHVLDSERRILMLLWMLYSLLAAAWASRFAFNLSMYCLSMAIDRNIAW